MATFFYEANGYLPYVNGAARSVQTLFRELVKRGHKCVAVVKREPAVGAKEQSIDVDGIACQRTNDRPTWTERTLRHYHPDILLIPSGREPWVFDMAAKYKVPIILRVPDLSSELCANPADLWTCERLCAQGEPCVHNLHAALKPFFEKTFLMANSRHTANAVKAVVGVDSTVVYPTVDPSRHLVSNTGKRITLVKGIMHKGIDLFLHIARSLPQYPYLIVRGVAPGKDTRGIKDLAVYPQVDDMKPMWSQTKVLLVPSLVEPFGRVPVEAGVSGIPTVASDRGGLPESAGRDACVPVEDVDEWIRRVRLLMEDPSYYKQCSDYARRNAAQFDIRTSVDTFLQLASRACGRQL